MSTIKEMSTDRNDGECYGRDGTDAIERFPASRHDRKYVELLARTSRGEGICYLGVGGSVYLV